VEAETLACGTGAVAAALVLWDQFPKKQALQVLCASGELLTVRKEGSSLFLKGAVSPL
jgi:diaminopimelate epimerase